MRRTVSSLIVLVAAAAAALTLTPATARAGGGQGYPYPPYPYYNPYSPYGGDASLRIEVKPKEAQVYVDGYFAGIVDDFDGLFQRLHVPPGDHNLVIYLEGYQSVREHLTLAPSHTYKIKYTMRKLAPGEANEPRPVPPAPPAGAQQRRRPPQPPMWYPGQGQQGPPPPPPNAPPMQQGAASQREYGVLAIRVQPPDADVLIDGQPWKGPAGEERLLVQVPNGTHHIEIRKQGFRAFTTDIVVHGGETVPLNVSLSAGDGR